MQDQRPTAKRGELLQTPKSPALAGSLLKDDKIFEVRQALKTLGYNAREINRALSKMKADEIKDKKVEDILKIALKEV